MPANKKPIPILITLVGNTSVGKSYYLFSLGLALKKYRSMRNKWVVLELSDAYETQIKQWKKEHRQHNRLGVTNSGTNLQLSFILKNKDLDRRYQIILADMAGEDIVRCLKKEHDLQRISKSLELRLRLSSGILLMMDSRPFDEQFRCQDQDEIEAWEKMVRTKLFHSVGICLMKADILAPVKEKLEPLQTLMKKDPVSFLFDLELFDDNGPAGLEDYARLEFDKPLTRGIKNLLHNQGIEPRFHYLSSVGVLEPDGSLPALNDHIDEFVSYNIFKPILDTLEAVEMNFNHGFWANCQAFIINLKWQGLYRRALALSNNKKYLQAIDLLFNKDLHQDTRRYFPVFQNFSYTLGDIQQKWLQARIDYENRLPAKSLPEQLKNILESCDNNLQAVVEDYEYNLDKDSYLKKLTNEFLARLPNNSGEPDAHSFDYSAAIGLLQEQYIELRQNSNDTTDLESFLQKLMNDELDRISKHALRNDNVNGDLNRLFLATLSQAQTLSFWLAIHKSGISDWKLTIESKLGPPVDSGTRLQKFVAIIVKKTQKYCQFSIAFKYLRLLEDACKGQYKLFGIPVHFFNNTARHIGQLRQNIFAGIPSVKYIDKKNSPNWLFDDALFETFYLEWDFWQGQNSDFNIPRRLKKRFPRELVICPRCHDKKQFEALCPDCLQWGLLTRFFRKKCKRCHGSKKIAVICTHCHGTGKRNFVAKVKQDYNQDVEINKLYH